MEFAAALFLPAQIRSYDAPAEQSYSVLWPWDLATHRNFLASSVLLLRGGK
jgi:hypothetical protein